MRKNGGTFRQAPYTPPPSPSLPLPPSVLMTRLVSAQLVRSGFLIQICVVYQLTQFFFTNYVQLTSESSQPVSSILSLYGYHCVSDLYTVFECIGRVGNSLFRSSAQNCSVLRSDHELLVHVARYKRAIVSNSLKSLFTKERREQTALIAL